MVRPTGMADGTGMALAVNGVEGGDLRSFRSQKLCL